MSEERGGSKTLCLIFVCIAGRMAFKAPDVFDFSMPSEWPQWRDRWTRFKMASKLYKDPEEVQVSALIYSMGPAAEHLLSSFDMSEARKKLIDPVLKEFDQYFSPKTNVIAERQAFESRAQRRGETNESFIRALLLMAEKCGFGDTKSERIRDRLISGMSNKELAKKIQIQALDTDITLEKVIAMMRSCDLVEGKHDHDVDSVAQSAPQHDADGAQTVSEHQRGASQPQPQRLQPRQQSWLHRPMYRRNLQRQHYQPVRPQRPPWRPQQYQRSADMMCKYCGRRRHQSPSECPAQGAPCFSCGGLNHFQAVCFDSQRTVRDVQTEDDGFLLGDVHKSKCDMWMIDVMVKGSRLTFKVDTGADISIITHDQFKRMSNVPPLRRCEPKVTSVGGALKVHGVFRAEMFYKDKVMTDDFYVVETNMSHNLLSSSAS